jgi:hypothetical protein
LARGSDRGTANTSPSGNRRGWACTPELTKLPAVACKPARAIAFADAGITPRFTAITSRFMAPPSAVNHMYGRRRFTTTHAAPSP